MKKCDRYLILISICLVSCLGKPKLYTGFTKNFTKDYFESPDINCFNTLSVLGKWDTSGTFIVVNHPNLRKLTLFIPGKSSRNISFKDIIDMVENKSNPNEWPFYYCSFDFPGFRTFDSSARTYDDSFFRSPRYLIHETIIGQNELYKSRKRKVNEYEIWYRYRDSVSVCRASVDIAEMNKYNSYVHSQDLQPNVVPPSYIFEEKDKRMNILIVAGKHCR